MTEFNMTPVGQITEGPNVRSKLGDLSELAASLSSTGMLQPVTVRRKAVSGDLELVFGFRRFRAAKLAKLSLVPTLTRELTDDEVLEIQLTENGQREGCDPLDEAQGYRQLVEHGHTVVEIAAKMGRPPAYIAQRLRLCNLSDACTEALHNERITLGVALLLVKLPSADLQDKGLSLVAVDYEGDGPMPVAHAKGVIEQGVMRDLTAAPFDRVSLELLPAAGSCTACPKRTGAQVELFGDGTSPDLCTDPVCFRSKLDAHWANVQKEAKAKGLEVLAKAKAEAATRFYEGGDSGFRKLDDVVTIGTKKRTVRQLLGGKEAEPVAIARDENTGIPVELARKADVDAAIKAARKAAGAEVVEGPTDYEKKQAEERKAAKSRRAAFIEALAGGIEAKCKRGSDVTGPVLRGLVFAAIELASSEARAAVVKRRGLAPLAETPPERLLKLKAESETMFARLLSMLAELLVSGRDAFDGDSGEGESSGLLLLDALDLDVNAIIANRDAKPEKKPARAVPVEKNRPGAKAAAPKAKPKPEKKPAKAKGGKVHLIGPTGGPACGSKAAARGGTSTLTGVDCENCISVGPSILEQKATAKANRKKKPEVAAKKKAPKKAPRKGAKR